jgi:hypothetical protein
MIAAGVLVLARKMASSAVSILLLWAVGALLLGWSRFPAVWRRRIALVWGLAGLVSIVIALNTEGSRATPTVVVFLMGTPYVTATAQASASLSFYLLSGVFLLLGFAGLAVGDEIAVWLTAHPLAGATLLSLAITALRFALEKTAAPPLLSQIVGVTWLAPVVGAFLYWSAGSRGRTLGSMLGSLALYAVEVRGAIVLLMLLATHRRLGSHYDVSSVTLVQNPLTGQAHDFAPGSLTQFLSLAAIPQMAVWPLYTVAAGLIGAGLVMALEASWQASSRRAAVLSGAPPEADDVVNARGRP